MDYIEWSSELSVGVTKLDNDHKVLIEYVNRLNQALISGSKDNAICETLRGLVTYTKAHFANEEAFMEAFGYPRLNEHKAEHRNLTGKVEDFYSRYISGSANFSIELIIFLKEWLIDHITGTDMKYRDFYADLKSVTASA